MSAAVEGLTDLFGPELPADLRIALWRKEGKRSFYVSSFEEAAQFEGSTEVYVSAALVNAESAERIGPKARPKARDAAAIPGVWADVDVSGTPDGKGGAKTGAAPDSAAAMELAHAVLAPTLIVCSGYGLQPWWLFEEPWIFGSDDEREQAAQIVRGFQAALRERADFGLDAAHDLARLMRLPGTLNGKGQEPAPVEREEHDGPRYSLEALARAAQDSAPSRSSASVAVSVGAEFPRMKFDALRENSPEFRRTWDHERSGHPEWSDSEHDLSLASQAAHVGWTDEELAALIREHRQSRNGAGDGKALRQDYLERTVARAREGVGQDTEQSPPVTFDAATGKPLDALDLVRRDFPRLTGPNEITRVFKTGGKQASYVWELAGGETVELGTSKQLHKPRDVQAAVFDSTDPPVSIEVPSLEVWSKIVERIGAAAEVRAVTLDERDETAEWADDFLRKGIEEHFVEKDPDRTAKLNNLRERDPRSFVEGITAFVRLAHLRRHIVMYRREEPITTKKLSERLGRIGYRRREIAEREGGEVAKGGFYAGPWSGRA